MMDAILGLSLVGIGVWAYLAIAARISRGNHR